MAGVADAVRAKGIACFGPSAAAAKLEGSKAFAKDVMAAAGVPTARARVCTTPDEAAAALDEFGPPYVVKNDGLAAGKGVVVTDDRDAALAPRRRLRAASSSRSTSTAPRSPCSWSPTARPPCRCMPAQDFKRVGDGDTGPNTGGMGAYAPLPWAPPDLADDVMATVVHPTLREMRRRGTPFAGLLYVGLALTHDGPRVVEFNARFGDPETQVVLALLETPLAGLLHAAATGTLAAHPPLRWRDGAAVVVVVAAAGYPAAPRTGDVITGRRRGRRPARRHRTEGRRRRAGLRRGQGPRVYGHRARPRHCARRGVRTRRPASRSTARTTARDIALAAVEGRVHVPA